MKLHHTALTPNDLVTIDEVTYRLRYITRHDDEYGYYFQPGDEPLSPFRQNDVLKLFIHKDDDKWFEVKKLIIDKLSDMSRGI